MSLASNKSCLLALLIALFATTHLKGGAFYPPGYRWQTLESEHFALHFYQGLELVAERAIVLAEEVHTVLTERLEWTPDRKTQIVLLDNFQLSNGIATPFPYNTMILFASQPKQGGGEALAYYDDWMRVVITHEYTHILHLDMAHGGTRSIRNFLGRVLFPNLFEPLWIIEGIATYEESSLTHGGRLSGDFVDMILRTAILEDTFLTTSQAEGWMPSWPSGNARYVYGAKFMEFLAEKYGEDRLSDFFNAYAERFVPFRINLVAQEIFGKTFLTLWGEWRASLEWEYHTEIQEIMAAGLTPYEKVTNRGFDIGGPRFSPNGREIAFTDINTHQFPAIRLYRLDAKKKRQREKKVVNRHTGSSLSWSPDGAKIIFSQHNFVKTFSLLSDLYLYNIKRHSLKRLTRRARLEDPDFHPDGQRVVAVKNEAGRNALVLYDIESREQQILVPEEKGFVFSAPRWSPDGQCIAVARRGLGEFFDIVLYNYDGTFLQRLTHDDYLNTSPSWAADGQYLLFSSDRSGVSNLYAFAFNENRLYQITNLLTGAFQPSASEDQITFLVYGPRGFDVALMPLDPSSWREPGESDPRLIRYEYNPQPVETELHGYRAKETVKPTFWFPTLAVTADDTIAGFQTAGRDVLGKHTFSINLFVDTQNPGGFTYSLAYLNDSLYPTFAISALDSLFLHENIFLGSFDEDYVERQRRLSLDLSFPFRKFVQNAFFGLGVFGERISSAEESIPLFFSKPRAGDFVGYQARIGYGDTREYPFSISREQGRSFLMTYEKSLEDMGGDFEVETITVDWRQFFRVPFLRHHVLGLHLFGGQKEGDVLFQRQFILGGEIPRDLSLNRDSVPLRGYPDDLLRGDSVALGTLEYRFPIRYPQRGAKTYPLFRNKIHGTLFGDWGTVWDQSESFDRDRVKVSAGFELGFDMVFAYVSPVRLKIGFARRLDDVDPFFASHNTIYLILGHSF